jgi:simple sugar transport system ATP-binding protein
MNVSANTMIGYHDREPFCKWGFHLDHRAIRNHSAELIDNYDIRTPTTEVPAAQLSGGNQQKVILARELSRDPTFLLVSQPTRGLDVGAIEYIQRQILAMRDREVGILLISLELEEVFALADRILVLYEGKIVNEFIPEETDHKEVGYYMTGGKKE